MSDPKPNPSEMTPKELNNRINAIDTLGCPTDSQTARRDDYADELRERGEAIEIQSKVVPGNTRLPMED